MQELSDLAYPVIYPYNHIHITSSCISGVRLGLFTIAKDLSFNSKNEASVYYYS